MASKKKTSVEPSFTKAELDLIYGILPRTIRTTMLRSRAPSIPWLGSGAFVFKRFSSHVNEGKVLS